MNEQTEATLDAFLQHDSRRVLLLTGKWGVGKTFFWCKSYLPKLSEKPERIVEAKYVYVSLFGVETMEELEQLILAQARSMKALASQFERGKSRTKPHSSSFWNRAGDLRQALDLSWLKAIPGLKDAQGLVRRVCRALIQDTLVCVDDIERRGESLPLVSVLGLVSYLKEHNNCRFVLIMNEELLTDDDQGILAQYREKVVDQGLLYEPNVRDNASLVYTGADLDRYCPIFRRLELNNIRVMQQAKWTLEQFEAFTCRLEPSMQEQLREHVLLLACFFHESTLGVRVDQIPFDSLLDGVRSFLLDESDFAKSQRQLFAKYVYTPAEYDQHIFHYLTQGWFDTDAFTKALHNANQREKKQNVTTEYNQLWSAFRGNFRMNERGCFDLVSRFMDKNVQWLSWNELNQLLRFLEDIGLRKQLAAKKNVWVDAFVGERITSSGGEHLDQLAELTKNKELLDLIDTQRDSLKQDYSITEAIKRICATSGWNPEDVASLSAFSVEDYRREIERADDDEFLAILRELCRMWRGAGPGEQDVVNKIVLALEKLAKTSTLNLHRARSVAPWAFEEEKKDVASD